MALILCSLPQCQWKCLHSIKLIISRIYLANIITQLSAILILYTYTYIMYIIIHILL